MGLCVVEGSGYATGYSDGYADGQTDLLDTFEVGNDVTVSHEEACPSNNWSDYGYEDQASGHWIRSTCNICGKKGARKERWDDSVGRNWKRKFGAK